MVKKYKKIFIFPHDDVRFLREYCYFNNIEFEVIDCWDNKDLSYVIPTDIQNFRDTCLIISHLYLEDLYKSEKSYDTVSKFLQKNTIIASKDTGGIFHPYLYEDDIFVPSLKRLDNEIPRGSLKILLDGVMHESSPLFQCKNIVYYNAPTLERSVSKIPKITNATLDKTACEYDFLITTVLKKYQSYKPMRCLLKDKLSEKPLLKSKGFCIFHNDLSEKDKSWVGETMIEKYHNHFDSHPSMDLYSNAWIEVVPETCHKDFYYLTEKTQKPIITKTPFLILSTQGYLNFLREMGFKTFHPYIDETYDLESDLETRVEMVIESLEKIIYTGTEKIYKNVSFILEHNYKKYAEYCGKWEHDIDLFAKSFIDP